MEEQAGSEKGPKWTPVNPDQNARETQGDPPPTYKELKDYVAALQDEDPGNQALGVLHRTLVTRQSELGSLDAGTVARELREAAWKVGGAEQQEAFAGAVAQLELADPARMREAIKRHEAKRAAAEQGNRAQDARAKIREATRSEGLSDAEVAAASKALDRYQISDATTSPKTSASPERQATSPLVEQVTAAAKDKTLVYTSLDRASAGYQTLGDGAPSNQEEATQMLPDRLLNYDRIFNGETDSYVKDMVEAASFTPVEEKVYADVTRVEKKRGLFGREKEERITTREETDSKPVMIINPATGRQEKAVYFDYVFSPHLAGNLTSISDYPPYIDYSERNGNMLLVRTTIPESLANNLRAEIEKNPQLAREAAEQLVIKRTDLSKEAWEHGEGERPARVKPPYEDLPPRHRLYMVEPGTDKDGYQVLRGRQISKPFTAA